MATILLLEPHPLLRLGLRHLLAQAHVPGDLVDLDSTALHDPDPWTHHADLLVFGLPADAEQGWLTLADLCRRLTPLRVLVLADQLPMPLPESGMPDAVRGLLAKTCSADGLEAAIRLVLAGGECFPSQLPATRHAEPGAAEARHDAAPIVVPLHRVPGSLADAAHAQAAAPETPAAGAHLLNITERQYEVLALLARGYPIKTVSRLLNISVATAKTHACTLYQRLHVRNKGEAVYVALQRGATLNWPGPTPAQPTHIPMSSLSAREACEAA
ncbi:response regulator transcription factor [Cupriavidus sp. D384]|uniref:helix-turn-helix transcriptional regulator n=1 Tax=Cupriavidus sp. D384 TaxID=1538095 RepID=UPI00082DCBCE|nr:response regulator transcription factor [Cupriavidus sp. D384]